MAATQFSIMGQFNLDVYAQIVDRLTAASHTAEAFDCEETLMERGTSAF